MRLKEIVNKNTKKYTRVDDVKKYLSRQTRPRADEKGASNARFSLRARASIASSPRGLMGLIAHSFLGTRDFPGSRRGFPPFSLTIAGHTGEWGLSPCIY
jgi:hypothetical protein